MFVSLKPGGDSLRSPLQILFLKIIGGHKSFSLGHWYSCFGLLLKSVLGFKARVDFWLAHFLACTLFLRFTSGVTPADCIVSMAAESFGSTYLQIFSQYFWHRSKVIVYGFSYNACKSICGINDTWGFYKLDKGDNIDIKDCTIWKTFSNKIILPVRINLGTSAIHIWCPPFWANLAFACMWDFKILI